MVSGGFNKDKIVVAAMAGVVVVFLVVLVLSLSGAGEIYDPGEGEGPAKDPETAPSTAGLTTGAPAAKDKTGTAKKEEPVPPPEETKKPNPYLAWFAGKVTAGDGSPIKGAQVRVVRPMNIPTAKSLVHTDGEGCYIFKGLPPTYVHINVHKSGYCDVRRDLNLTDSFGRVIEGIDFVLPEEGKLTVTVMDEKGSPVTTDVTLSLMPPATIEAPASGGTLMGYFKAGTDSSGKVEFSALPGGQYKVTVDRDGYVKNETVADVVAGKTGSVKLTLAGSVTLSGKITDGNDKVAPLASVVLTSLDSDKPKRYSSSYWDRDPAMGLMRPGGTYCIKGIAPGTYKMIVTARGLRSLEEEVTLAPGDVVKNVVLESGGCISGCVEDTEGNPVVGATVTARGKKDFTARTDKDGKYRITAMPEGGTFRMRAKANGYWPAYKKEINPDEGDVSFTLKKCSLKITGTVKMVGPVNQGAIGWVRIYIKDPAKGPSPYIPFYFVFKDVQTGEAEFEIKDKPLKPGKYWIAAGYKRSKAGPAQKIEIKEDTDLSDIHLMIPEKSD